MRRVLIGAIRIILSRSKVTIANIGECESSGSFL